MTVPYTYTWAAADDNDYAIVGNPITETTVNIPANATGAAIIYVLPINSNEPANLVGNSTALSGAYVYQSLPPINNGVANLYRSVRIISHGAILTGLTFNISGKGNLVELSAGNTCVISQPLNEDITENIAGPAANAATETTKVYTKITSITVTIPNGFAGGGVSIGMGSFGITNPYMLDTNRKVFNTSAQVLMDEHDNGAVNVFHSASYNAIPQTYVGSAPFTYYPWVGFQYAPDSYDVQANALFTSQITTRSMWFYVTENSTANYTLTIIQQGMV
jgi:hypothetical protein